MKYNLAIILVASLLSGVHYAQAQEGVDREAFKAAIDKCETANPRPERPERGTKPTEEHKAAVDAHRTAMKTCMETAGFTLPDRPPHHRKGDQRRGHGTGQ